MASYALLGALRLDSTIPAVQKHCGGPQPHPRPGQTFSTASPVLAPSTRLDGRDRVESTREGSCFRREAWCSPHGTNRTLNENPHSSRRPPQSTTQSLNDVARLVPRCRLDLPPQEEIRDRERPQLATRYSDPVAAFLRGDTWAAVRRCHSP